MDATEQLPVVSLGYNIAGCSEHSGRYVAENIMVDSPMDQGSRWSGTHQQPNVQQWILLRLDSLSILKSITFGKFHRQHPCNMKEFKVFVGASEDRMTEILHSSLKNDPYPETFALRHTNRAGILFPTRYMKIVPLSSHGDNRFHTSIWFVSLSGIEDEHFVEEVRTKHDDYREAVVLRHVIKHLRQRRFISPLNNILSRSGLQLEHPLMSSLYDSLVLQGDWPAAERTLKSACNAGLFESYRHACQPLAEWSRLHGLDADGDAPCRRSGHAMCMDQHNGLIYLFGGWDGQRNLDDFWVYDVKLDTWRLLSLATSREQNGPGPRSCHKVVFDSKTGSIYLLGRLGDGDGREHADGAGSSSTGAERRTSPPPISITGATNVDAIARRPSTEALPPATSWSTHCSEFYRYHTRGLDAGKWDLLAIDTASSGGPPLIFDHQMAIDTDSQMIYVSGGRVIDGDWDSCKYSSLYSYNIRSGTWEMLQGSDVGSSHPCIPPRFGHSMLYDPESQSLFIFAGQRDDKFLADMYAYHIPTNTVHELFSDFSLVGGPDPSFTQRAVIDPELREIYLFCGLVRGQGSLTGFDLQSPNWIYRYDRPDRPGKWVKIMSAPDDYSSTAASGAVPALRYAHQVVYDAGTKAAYMHGGSAGTEDFIVTGAVRASRHGAAERREIRVIEQDREAPEVRLDDLWSMQLKRPAPDDVIRKANFEVRQQQFREMCEDAPPIKALTFLQTEISAVVNHSDAEEAQNFRSLLSHLLAVPPPATTSRSDPPSPTSGFSGRYTDHSTRTRPGTPAPIVGAAGDFELLGEIGVDETPTAIPHHRPVVTLDVDAEEGARSGSPPAPERFKQRTQVFEKLLNFVNESDKQPEKNLLELIDTDEVED